MNKLKEFEKIKSNIAIKAVGKIIGYSAIVIIVLIILVDGIYNDSIANSLYNFDGAIYAFFVQNKLIITVIAFATIFFVITYIVIRNTTNNLVIIISAMDQITKNPEESIKLPISLAPIEIKLNEIRTELVNSRKEAEEAETKKNDLIMYMAHDLKTPLTSVIGYLTFLKEEKGIDHKMQDKFVDIALNKALRVEELTNQFFEITRYNLHNMIINKKQIDLSILIEQLIDECYPMLQERKLECKTDMPEHIYYTGDGDKLARAFGNLLKNAINYSYENTEIQIIVEQSENKINMVFRNKGDKIPDYKLEKLFDKFYRGDESRTSSTGGTGLGLAITKEIIELHNGKIYVKNDDEYIEFYVEL